ncbi:hypothetical protein [Pseudomonas sp. Marseille-Q5115]|uniref:hypothetical protein n=1 Tax=Pseudomonas sp. Marseille-Q5115 TaxID=2866593 RepID=UPI001CE4B4D0|nr:hypothetical protein [Pseudomonas sp. Marseille-Q5115]
MLCDTDEEKAGRLAEWEGLLNDAQAQANLDTWHADLRRLAAALCAQGVVDSLEHLELRELADAAYSHFVEDRITREAQGGTYIEEPR